MKNNNKNLDKNIQTNPTIFGKILRGEIPADKVYEDDMIFAFKDIQPRAKVHILVIPKAHIKDIREAKEEHEELLGHLMLTIPKIAELEGLNADGFRIIVNNGEYAGQEVPHLHFHLLGGEKLKNF